jgi:hypothetical protein
MLLLLLLLLQGQEDPSGKDSSNHSAVFDLELSHRGGGSGRGGGASGALARLASSSSAVHDDSGAGDPSVRLPSGLLQRVIYLGRPMAEFELDVSAGVQAAGQQRGQAAGQERAEAAGPAGSCRRCLTGRLRWKFVGWQMPSPATCIWLGGRHAGRGTKHQQQAQAATAAPSSPSARAAAARRAGGARRLLLHL